MRRCVTCKEEKPLKEFKLITASRRKRLIKMGYAAAENERYLQCNLCRVHPHMSTNGVLQGNKYKGNLSCQ